MVSDAGGGASVVVIGAAATETMAASTAAVSTSGIGLIAGGVAVLAAAFGGGTSGSVSTSAVTPAPLDTTAPQLRITATPTKATTNGAVDYTFSFGEDVTGFTAEKVILTHASQGVFTRIDARTYTLSVIPAPGSAGNITVDVAAGAAHDAAGNASVAATQAVQGFDTANPLFTSAATASTAENTTVSAVVYKAVVTDNVAVTAYAFADGGADNRKFTIDSATGEIKFKVSPDFEAPASAAGSNAYSLKLRATDAAGNTSVQDVTIHVADVDEIASAAPTLAMANDTNTPGDFLTRDGTLNLSGLEVGATWAYSTDGGAHWLAGNGGAAAASSTASIDLPAGTYQNGSLLVRQSDAAGNASAEGGLTHPLYPAVQRLSYLSPTDYYVTDPKISVLKDGSNVVAWQTATVDGQGNDLLVQRFNASGATQGPAQRLQAMAGVMNDFLQSVTPLNDGGYVVTWYGDAGDGQGTDIFVQRFGAANADVGTVQRLQGMAGNLYDYNPQTMALSDGGYVLTWQGETSDGQAYDTFVQRFDAANAAVGSTQRLQGMAGSLNDGAAQTTALRDGGYVLTWQSGTSDGQGTDIFVQRFDAANAAVGSVQRVQGMAGNLYDDGAHTLALADGGYVLTWRGETSDGQSYDVFVQRFDAANAALGNVQRLHGMSGSLFDYSPQTTSLSDGGYVLTWQGDTSDGQYYDIFLQRFDATSAAVGSAQRLHGMTGSLADSPAQTTALSGGGYVVTWQGATSNDQAQDIFVQRFDVANAAVGSVQRLQGMSGNLYDYGAQTVALAGDGCVVMWQGNTSDGQNADVFFQRFDATGAAVGGLQRVQGEQEGQRLDVYASMKAMPDGGFVIAWTNGDGWTGGDVFADAVLVARYDAQGQAVQNPGAPLVVDPVPPAFTNASSQSLSLYATDPATTYGFYDAQATANGGTAEASDIGVLYRLGGADAALFNIDSKSGVLSFKTAPNTATPPDAGADNTYDLTFTAIDNGGNTAVQNLAVTVLPVPATPAIRLQGEPGLWNSSPQLTALQGGGYVVTWNGATSSTTLGRDIFVQRYDAANTAVGTTTRLNGDYWDENPQVAALADGGYVLGWNTEYNSLLQRFDQGGALVGTQQAAGYNYYGNSPRLAGLPDGGYVAAWSDDYNVYVQRYGAGNAPVGSRATLQGVSGLQDVNPQLAVLNDGGYVVTWQGETSDAQGADIFVQRYSAANSAVGGVQRLQGQAGNLNDGAPQIAALSDGGYVMAWRGDTSDGQGVDVFMQRFDASGAGVGSLQRLQGMPGNLADGYYYSDVGPNISALPDGGYVVTWSGATSDEQSFDILARRFDMANAPVGDVHRLQGASGRNDQDPQVTALADGGYVLVWGDFDICVQRFAADNTPVGDIYRMQGDVGVQTDYSPQVVALSDGGFTVAWNGYTSNGQRSDIFVQRFDAQGHAIAENGLAAFSSAQAFSLWQDAELAWQDQQNAVSNSTHDINALNTHGTAIMQQHDATGADGTANGSNALSQYINQVTGTDIVSQAEYQAGFAISGHAAAGGSASIKFYLDNDRTDGVSQAGTQLQDGVNGVHIAYSNITGDYTVSFDASSSALKPATHGSWGSGIHQLTVDADGSGAKNGTEASRLFLVADGTAHSSNTGTAAQNYSVEDQVTGDVFVYYSGDPDGLGVSLSTALDNGDTNTNSGLLMTDKDGTVGGVYGDYDYYTSNIGSTVPATTAANTAMHLLTNIAAQTWEFHMASQLSAGSQIEVTWEQANMQAVDHTLFASNTSRLASLEEAIALYAANFGGDNGGENTAGSTVAGAIQPLSNATWSSFDRTPTAAEDNHPRYWEHDIWTAAPVPGGHAVMDLYYANIAVFPIDFTQHGVVAVL